MNKIIVLSAIIFALTPIPCSGNSIDNVLLLFNERSSVSIETAMYYKKIRGLDNKNVFKINTYPQEEISRNIFEKEIKEPLKRYLLNNEMQDQIFYIVTTKGVPLKIAGSGGRNGDRASVDSELTLLYREMIYGDFFKKGTINNPYFNSDPLFTGIKNFNHQDFDIYLVTRLTGFTLHDIIDLIKKGVTNTTIDINHSNFILDKKGDNKSPGEIWLEEAAELLMDSYYSVELEKTAKFLTGKQNVMGYAGWGSNDPHYSGRFLHNTYIDGALATNYVSSNGRTFYEPPKLWAPGSFKNLKSYFRGSPQSLAGDFIREGITGVSSNVYEPYLDACIRPNILFPAYTAGYNLAESFYMAMKYLSWQSTIVGDPLCSPFGDPGLYLKITRKPHHFHNRKLKIEKLAAAKYNNADICNLLGRIYLAKNNLLMAQKAFQEAVLLDKKHVSSFVKLAIVYQGLGETTQAEDIYRKILKIKPDHVLALNNLAYLLSNTDRKLDEAKHIVEKAFQLEPSHNVIDTYGWICYKKKEYSRAIELFKRALQISSNNPVILFHAGLTWLKLDNQENARLMMERALSISKYFPGADRAQKVLSDLR